MMMPNAYTSVLTEGCSPMISSGAIQNGVPIIPCELFMESPKSESLARKWSSTSTLPALRSLCSTGGEAAWRYTMPATTSFIRLRTMVGSRTTVSLCTTSYRLPCFMNSITISGSLSSSTTAPSTMVMFGCRKYTMICSSALNCSYNSLLEASSILNVFLLSERVSLDENLRSAIRTALAVSFSRNDVPVSLERLPCNFSCLGAICILLARGFERKSTLEFREAAMDEVPSQDPAGGGDLGPPACVFSSSGVA
mmetsp:Transcript_3197/g.4315  ORF Transcript_3197/g.4315 Transcript_3197/m.4315 type:complete len:253 (+) Transcript_3197:1152-1910(+)